MKSHFIRSVERVMFHSAESAPWSVCFVRDGIGHDAIGETYNVTTDDFGNVVFVKFKVIWVK